MSFDGTVVDRLLSVEQRMADPEKHRLAMERLRANPNEATFDEFEDAASGRVFQGFTAPVHDDHGGFLGRIWTLREVTQQRELDRLKDDFVARLDANGLQLQFGPVNLVVSNALKFTPAGGRVTVRTFVDGRHAVVEVEDDGIGIPEAEQGRLFQRFFRSSIATEQAIPGTGLGLVISRAIAEAHGGTIDVRSKAGAGACFRVELPLDPEEVAA